MSVSKLPPGITLMGLPYVSKQGHDTATFRSVIDALVHGKMPKTIFAWHGDDITSRARNSLAEQAMNMGAEWVFFVDSDMDFPVDTLERLKALDADIACIDMWSRNWPSFRTVLEYAPKKRFKAREFRPVAMGEKVSGQRDVDCCGMACTLIRTSLFLKFAKAKRAPFIVTNHGEDANFCIEAKRRFKATIRCDFDLVAGHWGRCRMVGQEFTRDARNQTGSLVDPEMMRRMGVRNLENINPKETVK